MAISPFYRPPAPLPTWMRVELIHDPVEYRARIGMAVRCRDGNAIVFDVKVDVSALVAVTIPLTRREVLEAMHKQVVVELSKLEMES